MSCAPTAQAGLRHRRTSRGREFFNLLSGLNVLESLPSEPNECRLLALSGLAEMVCKLSALTGEADMRDRVTSTSSVAIDPSRT